MCTTLTAEERFAIALKNPLRLYWRKAGGGHFVGMFKRHPEALERYATYTFFEGDGNTEDILSDFQRRYEEIDSEQRH
jgi:hypothetical protein